jgi:nucleotide-binding universal stress UspA family protein
MFERILVPLDGSPRAEAILTQLDRILSREDSEIVLFRAYTVIHEAWPGVSPPSAAEEREAAEKYLHGIALNLSRQGVKVHTRVAEGMPAPSILEHADSEGATMIAMSTHGRSGVPRWVMGSVAEKVARASRVPVLLARSFRQGGTATAAGAAALRKILVPTDGSPTAMSVVGPAEKLAQLYGSKVVLLHVQEPQVPAVGFAGMEGAVLQAPLPPPDPEVALKPMAQRFEHAGLSVTSISRVGDPAAQILEQATAWGADLIALATHGRSGVSRWVLGSVAERVLRHADVPLLVVRAEAPQPRRRKKTAARAGRR